MFRKEAIEYQKWKSTAVLFFKLPTWLIFILSLFFTLICVLYISLGSYTRRQIIVGEIVMQPHPIILSSPKSGYISEVYTKVNQQIKKNQPLFKIRLERVTDSGSIDANSINFVKTQIAEIQKIIKLLHKNKGETVTNLEKQIANNIKVKNEVLLYSKEIERSITKYLGLYQRYQKLLKRGEVSNDEVNNQHSKYLGYKEILNDLQLKLIQLESTILNLNNEIEAKKVDFDNQIIKYEIQISDLKIRLMELESVYEVIVNSPAEGIVESTSATLGQVVKEGDSLAQIIPAKKGEYQLVMWVPNSAVSFVKPSDEVNIRYEAFPFEKFGQFKGKIEHISALPASLQELTFL